jgi:phage gp29-like protein
MPKNENVPAKPVLDEIVTSGDNLAVDGYIDEIARPVDPMLAASNGDLKEYRNLLRDDQVKTCLQQRRDAVIAAEWEVEPGGTGASDKAAADFIREQLQSIRFDTVSRKMLAGLFFGYSIAECLWAIDGNRVVLDRIKVKKQERFLFGRDGSIRLRTRTDPKGIVLPERKFWLFSVESDNDEDPHGLGLGYWCYWPVFLKRNAVKFWAIALEKFGAPTAKGNYRADATDAEKRKLLEALRAMTTDSAVIMPEGMTAELIEAQRRAGDSHEVFSAYMDKIIARVILGQTATTEVGPYVGTANVQKDVRDEIIKSDADLLCESFNQQIVTWLAEWNFPGAAVPQVWRKTDDDEDLDQRAKRELIIARTTGLRPTAKHVHEVYGGDWEKPAVSASDPAAGGLSFSEGRDRDPFEQAAADMASDWEPIVQPMLSPVLDLIDQVDSIEEFNERLGEAILKMDTGPFAERLANLRFQAATAGELGIENLDED